MKHFLSLIILAGVSVFCLAQGVVPEPIPDPVPNLVTGPITEALERRLEAKFTAEIERQARLIDAMEARLGERLTERFSTTLAEIKTNHQTLFGLVREFYREREGLLERIRESYAANERLLGEFAPLRKLIERFTAFGWSLSGFLWMLLGLVLTFLFVLLFLIAVVARLYLMVRNTVIPKELRS